MCSIEELILKCRVEKNHHGLTISESYKNYIEWFALYRNGDLSLKNNLDGMHINSLTEEEAFFILSYTSSFSSWINEGLRSGNKLPFCKSKFAERLDNSLEKMPSWNGKITFRMDYPSGGQQEILDWFDRHLKKIICVPSFLSTSKEDFENSPIVWQITTLQENSWGKDISNLTKNTPELEVLFKRKAKFQIIGVNKVKKYIYMEEKAPANVSDINLIGLYHLNIQ